MENWLSADDQDYQYALEHVCEHLIQGCLWEDVEILLRDLWFVERKAEKPLDLANAARNLPPERPCRRIFQLLEEGLRRETGFIVRHPKSLFQCLWNSCAWHDKLQYFDIGGDVFNDKKASGSYLHFPKKL